MGRMLDALRRADNAQPEKDERRLALPLTVAKPEEETPCADEEDEVPFIEVGPRKSMEASPSVLACASAAKLRSTEAIASPPRSVHFRAVPHRAAPHSRFAPELTAYHAPQSPAALQYRDVLDDVLQAANERPAALLFTPIRPRIGNTTTLLNVAITAARRERQRIAVVEANLRQSAFAERLGLPAVPGLREVLAGAAELDEVLQATEQANLFAVTAGVQEATGVRFRAATLRSLLRQLRHRFSLVFVDGSPWDDQMDAPALATACDAVFVVTPEQEAETPQTDALLQLIPTRGAPLAGCILVA